MTNSTMFRLFSLCGNNTRQRIEFGTVGGILKSYVDSLSGLNRISALIDGHLTAGYIGFFNHYYHIL